MWWDCLLGTVGIDPVVGAQRFNFGFSKLAEGFDFVVVVMGLFGITEILCNVESPEIREVFKTAIKGLYPNLEDWRRCWASVLRGSFIGFFIGVSSGRRGNYQLLCLLRRRKKCLQASGGVWQGGYRGGGGA